MEKLPGIFKKENELSGIWRKTVSWSDVNEIYKIKNIGEVNRIPIDDLYPEKKKSKCITCKIF